MATDPVVETPYEQPLFAAVRGAVESLHRDWGPLYFAALLQLAERPRDEWVLLVGSQKLAENPLHGTKEVSQALARSVAPEFARKVRKLGVVDQKDPVFLFFARLFSVNPVGHVLLRNCKVNGLEIDHCLIYAATSPPSAAAAAAHQ